MALSRSRKEIVSHFLFSPFGATTVSHTQSLIRWCRYSLSVQSGLRETLWLVHSVIHFITCTCSVPAVTSENVLCEKALVHPQSSRIYTCPLASSVTLDFCLPAFTLLNFAWLPSYCQTLVLLCTTWSFHHTWHACEWGNGFSSKMKFWWTNLLNRPTLLED